MATKPSIAENAEKAISIWLKKAVKSSTLRPEQERTLNFAIDLVSLTAGYVIATVEKGGEPNARELTIYLSKKSVAMSQLVDAKPLQCIAAVADFGIESVTEGPRLAAGLASSATGFGMLLALRASLALLVKASDVWIHCAPVVRQWVARMQREVDVDLVLQDAMAKLPHYTLNYVPDPEIARTA